MKTKDLVLVVGAPRSGTTLLQTMLMRIEGLWFPPETHFFATTWMQRGHLGDLARDRNVDRYLRIVRDRVCLHNELDVDWPLLERELRSADRDLAHWFDTLLQHLKNRAPACRRIGEKSPNHLRVADHVLERFPDSRVINVIRDGRDVAVSSREAFKPPMSVAHLALRWRVYQCEHRSLARRWPEDRYTSVRYEALVADPEPELSRLCEFLGEHYTTDMLEPHKRQSLGFASRETHKLRTLEPITTTRVGRYRGVLTPLEVVTYQAIAGSELRRLSYSLDKVPVAKALCLLPAELARIAVARLRWRLRQRTLGL